MHGEIAMGIAMGNCHGDRFLGQLPWGNCHGCHGDRFLGLTTVRTAVGSLRNLSQCLSPRLVRIVFCLLLALAAAFRLFTFHLAKRFWGWTCFSCHFRISSIQSCEEILLRANFSSLLWHRICSYKKSTWSNSSPNEWLHVSSAAAITSSRKGILRWIKWWMRRRLRLKQAFSAILFVEWISEDLNSTTKTNLLPDSIRINNILPRFWQ